ncbi:MAG: type II toxin-antitoxin system YafQ family toxin [Candidatus Paceibacterota bacterium]|jgi:mRNA interferase YafQ
MYRIKSHKKFEKGLEKLKKKGLKQKHVDGLYLVIGILSKGGKLGLEYHDHKLRGEYEGFRECHIQGDLLLVYQIIKDELVLVLIDIGTHSYLF